MSTRRPHRPGGWLTPRLAGAALIVVSAAVGVAAAASLSAPVWGIPAAILLAFASVGVLAGLLTVQRKSWADKTWPPSVGSVRGAQKTMRRLMLFCGGFLLVTAAAAILGSVLNGAPAEDLGAQWMLVATIGIIGIGFVVLGARSAPAAVSSTERPVRDGDPVSPGWVRLGTETSVPRFPPGLAFRQPLLLVLLLPAWLSLAAQIDLRAAVFMLIGVLIVAIVGILLARRGRPAPEVSVDGSAIRARDKEMPATTVTAASIAYAPWESDAAARDLMVNFTAAGGRRVTVGLRRRGQLVLTESETAALLRFVEQTAIELPRDKEDPTGRFSAALYPAHMTKAQVAVLIERPPGDGEPLPVGPLAG
jgi:MFS family permease